MRNDLRHRWAVQKIDVKPHERVLEIGCGYGITASLLSEKLHTGKIIAIDRSSAMINKAKANNQAAISSGRAEFITGTLFSVNLEDNSFDKAFAFNVSLFMRNPAKELKILAGLLQPQGQLFIFHQPPFENAQTVEQQIRKALEKNGYKIVESEVRPALPASIVGMVSTPTG